MKISAAIHRYFFVVSLVCWGWGARAALADAPLTDPVHIVQSGEFLISIAARYNLPPPALIDHNHLETPDFIYPGQRLDLPGAVALLDEYTTHTVAPGETLSGIAAAHGLALTVLQTHNVIQDSHHITVGRTLYLPRILTAAATISRTVPPAVVITPSLEITATEAITRTDQRIVVDLSEQRAYVYEGAQEIYAFIVSTGKAGQETAIGTYQIQNKLPVAYAATWDLQMPYWLGFYWAGSLQNGFHALPILSNGEQLWRGALGRPTSYGCVILDPADAQLLFEWAEVGAEVVIQP